MQPPSLFPRILQSYICITNEIIGKVWGEKMHKKPHAEHGNPEIWARGREEVSEGCSAQQPQETTLT